MVQCRPFSKLVTTNNCLITGNRTPPKYTVNSTSVAFTCHLYFAYWNCFTYTIVCGAFYECQWNQQITASVAKAPCDRIKNVYNIYICIYILYVANFGTSSKAVK